MGSSNENAAGSAGGFLLKPLTIIEPMLLNELQQGAKFMFADRNTPIALAKQRGQHVSTGVFVYIKPDPSGYITLKHIDTGKELVAIAVTSFRTILTNV